LRIVGGEKNQTNFAHIEMLSRSVEPSKFPIQNRVCDFISFHSQAKNECEISKINEARKRNEEKISS
jgi:ribosomal protein L18E